jgi:hypothetical protein
MTPVPDVLTRPNVKPKRFFYALPRVRKNTGFTVKVRQMSDDAGEVRQ